MNTITQGNATVESLTATIKQAVLDGYPNFRKYITHNSRMLKGKTQVGLNALAADFERIGYTVEREEVMTAEQQQITNELALEWLDSNPSVSIYAYTANESWKAATASNLEEASEKLEQLLSNKPQSIIRYEVA